MIFLLLLCVKCIDVFLFVAYNIYRKISMRGDFMGDHQNNARIFKAFCDENRLQILEMLQSGEKCACVLLEQLNITQPTLSHHMKILVESGVVSPRRDGKWTHYSISDQGAETAKKLLSALLERSENRVCGEDCLCK